MCEVDFKPIKYTDAEEKEEESAFHSRTSLHSFGSPKSKKKVAQQSTLLSSFFNRNSIL